MVANITEGMLATAEKIKAIMKCGHLPRRRVMPYIFAKDLANCLEHACFNLSDIQLISNGFDENDALTFGDFYKNENELDATTRIIEFIKCSGLMIEESGIDKPILKNQWKVALYFNHLEGKQRSFHFLKMEEAKLWSDKLGWSMQVRSFDTAPNELGVYTRFGIFDITNPFVEVEIEQ